MAQTAGNGGGFKGAAFKILRHKCKCSFPFSFSYSPKTPRELVPRLSFHKICFAFYDEILPKCLLFLHLYIFLDFFQKKFGDFLTFLNNFDIQDLGSNMADFFKCMTSLWRVWHVTTTKIKIFGCFIYHVSFIFIAWILFEIHGGGGHYLLPPGSQMKKGY